MNPMKVNIGGSLIILIWTTISIPRGCSNNKTIGIKNKAADYSLSFIGNGKGKFCRYTSCQVATLRRMTRIMIILDVP